MVSEGWCGVESVVLLLDNLASPFLHALSRQALAPNGEGALVGSSGDFTSGPSFILEKKFTSNRSPPPPPCDSDGLPLTTRTMKTDFQVSPMHRPGKLH